MEPLFGYYDENSLFSELPKELIAHIICLSKSVEFFLAQASVLGYKNMDRKEVLCAQFAKFIHSTRRKFVAQGLTSMQRKFLYTICNQHGVSATKRDINVKEECGRCNGNPGCECCGVLVLIVQELVNVVDTDLQMLY